MHACCMAMLQTAMLQRCVVIVALTVLQTLQHLHDQIIKMHILVQYCIPGEGSVCSIVPKDCVHVQHTTILCARGL